jgi:hypothetical protein
MLLTTTWKPLAIDDEPDTMVSARPVSGSFPVIVVGVFFYQKALENICGGRREEGIELHVQAKIIPYDDNPDDAHAVRIEIEDEIVGHLSRKQASVWRSKMISEDFSGAVECPAKIAWDRVFDKEGSYGVWLDIDLTLQDSKPERHSANDTVVQTNQSDHIEFFVDELNRFELLNCKVGDEVNLWQKGDSKEIFIYSKGVDFGQGKIGFCPYSVYKVLRAAVGWDASIASIYEGGCKVDCRLVSKAEMAERSAQFKAAKKEAVKLEVLEKRDKLRKELDTKYSPKKPIRGMFHLNIDHNLMNDDKLYLGIKEKEYYIKQITPINLYELRLELLNQEKRIIGYIYYPRAIVIKIIRAYYSGYHLDISMFSEVQSPYWHAHVDLNDRDIEIVPKKEI